MHFCEAFPCITHENAPSNFKNSPTSIHLSQKNSHILDASLNLNKDCVSIPSANIPTTLTSNSFKLHLSQCTEIFQSFHHAGTRVSEQSSSITPLSNQAPDILSNSLSDFQLQPQYPDSLPVNYFVAF